MSAGIFFHFALLTAVASDAPQDGMETIYKEKSLIIRAPAGENWCNYKAVRLEPATFAPDPPRDGKQPRALTAKEQLSLDKFLKQLDADLSAAFQPLNQPAPAAPYRIMTIAPKLRKLNRNSPWLNVVGLAALQSPLKGSSLVLELSLLDSSTKRSVGAVTLAGKGLWADQIDLKQTVKRFQYSVSRLGQAQANAKAWGKKAAEQLDRLTECENGAPASGSQPSKRDLQRRDR